MALFGRGSFIDTAVARPATFAFTDDHKEDASTCMDLLPLNSLIGSSVSSYSCLNDELLGFGDTALSGLVQEWIGSLTSLDAAELNAMAYIANQNWFTYRGDGANRTLEVNYDAGIDVDVPVIPKAGMIVTSIVMGLFFIGLFGMVGYGLSTRTWTDHLDAFTMLRIGGAMPEKLPLEVGKHQDTIKDLDEMAGWVGEGSGEGEYIGRLAVGVNSMVKPNKRYACYKGDDERLDYKERSDYEKSVGAA
jgi:hypothetical protein